MIKKIKASLNVDDCVVGLKHSIKTQTTQIRDALKKMESPLDNTGFDSVEGTELVSKNLECIADMLGRLSKYIVDANESIDVPAIYELDQVLPLLADKLPTIVRHQMVSAHGWLPVGLVFEFDSKRSRTRAGKGRLNINAVDPLGDWENSSRKS